MMKSSANSASASASPQVTPPAKYKIVILGDQGVGKTSLLTRFMYESFEENYLSTVGIDFCSKTMCVVVVCGACAVRVRVLCCAVRMLCFAVICCCCSFEPACSTRRGSDK